MGVSVLTIVRNRSAHLAQLVEGLRRSDRRPDELIVVDMSDDPITVGPTSFPVRIERFETDGLPLAAARNRAAALANHDMLVFLDVDCIPAPSLIEDYAAAAEANDGVLMGEVGYLPKGATASGIDYEAFERLAVKHADRAGPPRDMVGRCGDYRCFWSLNFALSARTFQEVGGFDPRYVGYGGEDTDFGRTVTARFPFKFRNCIFLKHGTNFFDPLSSL